MGVPVGVASLRVVLPRPPVDFVERRQSIGRRHIFCVNGEGDAPLRIGQVDCEIIFGARRAGADDDLLFRDFVLPVSSPENTRRISRVALRYRLEGFPLLHLDFYKDDPGGVNWPSWTRAQRLKRTEPNRGIRFQRIRPAIEAVRASAGLTICGLVLLGPYLEDGSRFRRDALLRPQVKRFREWLVGEAKVTADWLSQRVRSAKGRRGRLRTTE